jgi:hypothetical protein
MTAEHQPSIVQGLSARHPLYGFGLSNPDPRRWNLEILPARTDVLLLTDTASSTPACIGACAINPLLRYGPHALRLLDPTLPEEELRTFFTHAGRGAILNNGGTLATEVFFKYRGQFAYEATGTTRHPGTLVRVMVVRQPDCALLIFLVGTPRQLTESRALLDSVLTMHTPVSRDI